MALDKDEITTKIEMLELKSRAKEAELTAIYHELNQLRYLKEHASD